MWGKLKKNCNNNFNFGENLKQFLKSEKIMKNLRNFWRRFRKFEKILRKF